MKCSVKSAQNRATSMKVIVTMPLIAMLQTSCPCTSQGFAINGITSTTKEKCVPLTFGACACVHTHASFMQH